jgi:hypothetical protein
MRRRSFSTEALKWRLYGSTAGEAALQFVLVEDRFVAPLGHDGEVVQVRAGSSCALISSHLLAGSLCAPNTPGQDDESTEWQPMPRLRGRRLRSDRRRHRYASIATPCACGQAWVASSAGMGGTKITVTSHPQVSNTR